MGLLGLSWFRSKKEKELDIKERELNIKLKEKQLENRANLGNEETPVKLYKKIKFTNDVLTVVLNDGSVISKAGATEADFKKVRSATTDMEITNVILNKSVEKPKDDIARNIKAASNFDVLVNTGDFERDGGSLYLKGIKRSLPALLINKFAEIRHTVGEEALVEWEALKKFWMKCCLNPNAQSAEDLYAFLSKHQFKIDKHGNFYAYRRVVSSQTTDKALVEFVSNTYSKVKAVWKKKPSDYWVFDQDGGYTFKKTEENFSNTQTNLVGNLEELYLDLPNRQEKTYTDNHTRSFDYKVGTVITMPRHKGDDDNSVSCSKGFHAASKEYDYSSFGDTPILLIINPMDVLAVPHGEVGKLRTCRWFFASVLSKDEQHILDEEDFDVTDLGDIFEEKCLEDLEEHVKKGFTEEVQRHTFTLSNISSRDISSIVRKLELMKDAISNRISLVD